ncbi:hypothetical protein AAZX31_16G134300 [Glycine max]
MTFNTIMRMVSGKRYHGEDCDVEEARQFREIINELVTLGGANNTLGISWLCLGCLILMVWRRD